MRKIFEKNHIMIKNCLFDTFHLMLLSPVCNGISRKHVPYFHIESIIFSNEICIHQVAGHKSDAQVLTNQSVVFGFHSQQRFRTTMAIRHHYLFYWIWHCPMNAMKVPNVTSSYMWLMLSMDFNMEKRTSRSVLAVYENTALISQEPLGPTLILMHFPFCFI